MPPVRTPPRRNARDRWTVHGLLLPMSALRALNRAPTSDDELARMRSVVREGAQDRPGIYRMLSPEGEVVYVGKSKRVRSRLLSYFRCAYPEDKGARILREATNID